MQEHKTSRINFVLNNNKHGLKGGSWPKLYECPMRRRPDDRVTDPHIVWSSEPGRPKLIFLLAWKLGSHYFPLALATIYMFLPKTVYIIIIKCILIIVQFVCAHAESIIRSLLCAVLLCTVSAYRGLIASHGLCMRLHNKINK